MRSLDDHLSGPGPKRILALDGGGVRGVMTCAILEAMEEALRKRLPDDRREAFRLSDYFDLIGGTSTGAIVATWLALGHTAAETRKLYMRLAGQVFSRSSFRSKIGLKEKFDADRFTEITDNVFRDFATSRGLEPSYEVHLHDSLIRTGLALFAKRIDKASVWILHNHPKSKFWSPENLPWKDYLAGFPELSGGTPNASFDLRRFVQASASAPYYLKPIMRTIAKGVTAEFIDGGVSPHNNPALQLFQMATLKWREPQPKAPAEARSPFGFGWETGEDKLLVVSVGTGAWRKTTADARLKSLALGRALHALTTMIDDSSNAGIALLQALSRPKRPYWLNFELEDMRGLRIVDDPLLSYTRIDAGLDDAGLRELLGDDGVALLGASTRAFKPPLETAKMIRGLHELDNAKPENLDRLVTIGSAVGARYFKAEGNAYAALPRAFDLPTV
jgi:predicted acylesterase/phospholipase RssA